LSQSPIDAEALELLALHIDPVLGKSAALARNSLIGTSSLSLPLARYCSSIFHSIGRPWQSQPGHVDGVVAQHLLRADDEVLQDLVERVADMEMPLA
jgi:hypothetical protein